MAEADDALTTLSKQELSSFNRGVIRKRRSLADLIKEPRFEENENTAEIDMAILEKAASGVTSPPSEVFFPVTVYLSSGETERCIRGEREAKTADELGADGMVIRGGISTGYRNTGREAWCLPARVFFRYFIPFRSDTSFVERGNPDKCQIRS